VRHVEQHSENPGQREYDVQLRESQYAEQGGDGDRAEEHCPSQVGEHEYGQAADSVHPRTGEEAE
jgi:hypothetical protein